MKVPLLDLAAQHRPLRAELRDALDRVLDHHGYCLGPEVERFEQAIGTIVAPATAVGVSNGTDALVVALQALDIGVHDEVILPTFSFFATAAAVVRVGATPVFVDIDDTTFTMDVDATAAAITARTKALLPVHLYGQCAPMAAFAELARAHNLKIIEDAAQAIGATQGSRAAGTFGDLACFSFYPTKNLGATGEAGLITGRDPQLLERCRVLRNQGMAVRYQHDLMGGNYRMDGFQAAVLNVKLPHLPAWNTRRAELAARYSAALSPVAQCPITAPGNSHVFHQYTIRTPRRAALHHGLSEAGIATGIYYPIPLHRQPCLQPWAVEASFPVAERCANEVLSLPVFPELTDDQFDYVTTQIKSILS